MVDIDMIISYVNEYKTDTLAEFIQIANAKGVELNTETISVAKDYIASIWEYANRYNMNFVGGLQYINDKVNSVIA